jgi:hypothetical protein
MGTVFWDAEGRILVDFWLKEKPSTWLTIFSQKLHEKHPMTKTIALQYNT